jgi:enoyl-CoA hydratase/carnithine racemase
MTAYSNILYSVANGVAHIVLNRPERLNALDFGPGSAREEILAALSDADGDGDVGAILLRGAGRAFCAGGHLQKGAEKGRAEETPTVFDEHLFNEMVMRFNTGVRTTRKPVIAAVHGLCLGTAMSFVAQCDFVLAADDARFGLIEGRIGHPGASELVPVIGPAWAKFLILTGEMIDAKRARDMGLVLFVLKADELVARATDLAARIARMPRESAILNKVSINNMAEASGRAAGRLVGRSYDAMTKAMSWLAAAPDGRLFADIIRNEGIEEMKRARAQQYDKPWLRSDDK